MDKDELTKWALKNGWQMIAGNPSLTKPSSPNEAIVRLILKGGVLNAGDDAEFVITGNVFGARRSIARVGRDHHRGNCPQLGW